MNLQQLLNKGKTVLIDNGIDDADFDALQLMLYSTGYSHASFLLNKAENADDNTEKTYLEYIFRRADKEPLQYIIGKWQFYKSEFYVGDGVLIPRPETEELVEKCIQTVRERNYKTIYDLCTGTGCIGISIAKDCPNTECYLFDYYDGALKYTEQNVLLSGLKNVHIIKADILKDYLETIPDADLIVSNPPYIASEEICTLQTEVLKEPVTALDGGNDGLMFYDAIKKYWVKHLKNGGAVALECGENQSKLICDRFLYDFKVEIFNDSFGCDRFILGFNENGGKK